MFSGCLWIYRITLCWQFLRLSPVSCSEALLNKHASRLDEWEKKQNYGDWELELVTVTSVDIYIMEIKHWDLIALWCMFILHTFNHYAHVFTFLIIRKLTSNKCQWAALNTNKNKNDIKLFTSINVLSLMILVITLPPTHTK